MEDMPERGAARRHLGRPPQRRLARGASAPAGPATAPARSHVERLLQPLAADADAGHRDRRLSAGAGAGWAPSAATAVEALGVENFGQSGTIPDLYRYYGIDVDAILEACAAACLRQIRVHA